MPILIGPIRRGDMILVAHPNTDSYGLFVVDSITPPDIFAFPVNQIDPTVVAGVPKESEVFKVTTFQVEDIFAVFAAAATSP